MKQLTLILLHIAFWTSIQGQSYTSYLTGNTENIDVEPEFGICLMGGAGESDAAMIWFLERANGGDVVVIRASGSDGYNEYMYSELGVNVNSVETIVFNSIEAASDPYVLDKLSNAEAIWMAGGNQADYVQFWKDNEIENILNDHVNVKQGPIGGISAGTAILGQGYFGAIAGTVNEEEALANPFDSSIILGWDDFLNLPYLSNTIAESHLNDPDRLRYGRIFTFMARLGYDQGIRPLGVAPNEYCAIAIDENGIARAFGEYPTYEDDFVYFLQPNCEGPETPEIIEEGSPLTWDRDNEAVKVYKVPATVNGENTFDLNDWNTGNGGEWENWHAFEGNLTRDPEPEAPACFLSVQDMTASRIKVWPNPSNFEIFVQAEKDNLKDFLILDAAGRETARGSLSSERAISVQELEQGIYTLILIGDFQKYSTRFVKID